MAIEFDKGTPCLFRGEVTEVLSLGRGDKRVVRYEGMARECDIRELKPLPEGVQPIKITRYKDRYELGQEIAALKTAWEQARKNASESGELPALKEFWIEAGRILGTLPKDS